MKQERNKGERITRSFYLHKKDLIKVLPIKYVAHEKQSNIRKNLTFICSEKLGLYRQTNRMLQGVNIVYCGRENILQVNFVK